MQKSILLAFLLSTLDCNAQTRTSHEVQMGYGFLAREPVFNDLLTTYFNSFLNIPAVHLDFSNSYSATYRYAPRRRVSMGLTSVIASGTSYNNYLFESSSHSRHTSVVLSFESKFTHVDRPLLTLYTIIGLGGFVVYEEDLDRPYRQTNTYAWPTCQLTPLGIRYGKKIGFFAELGYGYKGVLNAGLSAKF